jgi:hypothetical protein
MRLCLVFLFGAALLPAQGFPGTQFFQIKEYLQMSDSQYVALLRANDELNRSLSESSRRIFTLQSEISAEGEKDSPDPMEIGTRFVEISRVCRELRTQFDAQLAKNVATLTDAQRTRLRALEDLAKQMGVVAEAQGMRILGDVPAPPQLGAPPLVYRLITTSSSAQFFPGCPAR